VPETDVKIEVASCNEICGMLLFVHDPIRKNINAVPADPGCSGIPGYSQPVRFEYCFIT